MRRRILASLLLVLVILLLPARNQDVWQRSLEKISTIITLVEDNYYRQVDYGKVVFSSIRGLLQTLDPHSQFLEPKNLARVKEEYKGKFYGLGIQIQKYEDRLMIVSVIEGTPAFRLGLQAGDVISHINGESTKPITTTEAVQKLRGPKGTKVKITVVREGLDKPLELTVIRGEVPLYSVPYAFIIGPDIGYIYVRNFAETTTRELKGKLKELSRKGMKKLILDFRYNTGGPLYQAIEISEEFLPKNALIVSTEGRRKAYNREYRAQFNNQYEDIPLVILINRSSASASEIVAGAIQDNDRGLIVGETSWGKGLVQTVFPLEDDTALALTTGRYLTPSGRTIQRDYTFFEDYILNKNEIPEEKREVKYTLGGRKVLGQGGITPDYEVKDTITRFTANIRFKGLFFSYAKKFAEGKTPLSKEYVFPEKGKWPSKIFPGKKVFSDNFMPGEEVLEDFKAYLRKEKFEYDDEVLEKVKDEVRRELRREIFSALLGIEVGRKADAELDPVIKKAIEVMPDSARVVE
ncbi:MAG: S41 family peptidase [Candidatus Aminicenantales bacterium]